MADSENSANEDRTGDEGIPTAGYPEGTVGPGAVIERPIERLVAPRVNPDCTLSFNQSSTTTATSSWARFRSFRAVFCCGRNWGSLWL